MKTTVERTLFAILLLSFINLIGCATEPTRNVAMTSHKTFTTESKSNEYFKVVLKSMNRGEYMVKMRIGGDARFYDAIYFDVEVQNIHTDKDVVAYEAVFRLITDEGTHIDCCATGWEGAFDGDMGEMKSNLLEPDTKKTGVIGFPLKKTSNPTKLIFDPSLLDIPAEKITFDLP